jgi:hypothetical protein
VACLTPQQGPPNPLRSRVWGSFEKGSASKRRLEGVGGEGSNCGWAPHTHSTRSQHGRPRANHPCSELRANRRAAGWSLLRVGSGSGGSAAGALSGGRARAPSTHSTGTNRPAWAQSISLGWQALQPQIKHQLRASQQPRPQELFHRTLWAGERRARGGSIGKRMRRTGSAPPHPPSPLPRQDDAVQQGGVPDRPARYQGPAGNQVGSWGLAAWSGCPAPLPALLLARTSLPTPACACNAPVQTGVQVGPTVAHGCARPNGCPPGPPTPNLTPNPTPAACRASVGANKPFFVQVGHGGGRTGDHNTEVPNKLMCARVKAEI